MADDLRRFLQYMEREIWYVSLLERERERERERETQTAERNYDGKMEGCLK
jgi:hypothetical protein